MDLSKLIEFKTPEVNPNADSGLLGDDDMSM